VRCGTAGLDAQLSELAKTGVERVFSELVSAVGHRRILEEALNSAARETF
jgi:hypothetical protein